jgi:deoxyribose-phosphate aldolase
MSSENENREISKEELARMIDHTLLKPEATYDEIANLCKEAIEYNFFSVCVNPFFVKFAKKPLEGSNVNIVSVVGFPLGASETYLKAVEAERAVKSGADEIDMAMNIGLFKSKDFLNVEKDIREVVNTISPKIVKVIIEACLLTDQEKVIASTIVISAGAQFVKTSTGFNKGGATVEDVALIRSVIGPNFGVKAAGGIRDFETAVKMVKAGASRIGASKSVEIVK